MPKATFHYIPGPPRPRQGGPVVKQKPVIAPIAVLPAKPPAPQRTDWSARPQLTMHADEPTKPIRHEAMEFLAQRIAEQNAWLDSNVGTGPFVVASA